MSNNFRLSHIQNGNSSRFSSDENEDMKKNMIHYYYFKNVLIFMVDTYNKVIDLKKYRVFDEIKIIYEVLGQVILKKAIELSSPVTESINKKTNRFGVENFDKLIKTKTFYNF